MLDGTTVRLCLGVAALLTLAVTFVNRTKRGDGGSRKPTDERFSAFQRTYLVVYLAAMMADWLQGPYVYALYESYGFTRGDNAMLFTCGFGSSAFFGTFIGALADNLGRRKFAMLYCVLYGVSCLTKHVSSFTVLLFGRLTGGIATSLLFSVFDSWMVSEHNRRNFDPELLSGTFSVAVFGNSLVAILAGEVGQMAADSMDLTPVSGNVYWGGYCTPFDVSIGFLILSMIAILMMWGENFGSKSGSGSVSGSAMQDSMMVALRTLWTNPQVLCLGIVCSIYEASMFIFVFMWTPALTEEGAPKPEYGHIFAAFMVMSMLGSQVFSLESDRRSIESIGRNALLIAACCHAVPIFTEDSVIRFMSFLAFEMTVGLYFPMMGTLKGVIVPEESRAAIYNLYRVPLNVIVVLVLVTKLDIKVAFSLTTVMLLIAVVCQSWLISARSGASPYRPVGKNLDMEFGLDDDELDG
jgi:hypothetical protein